MWGSAVADVAVIEEGSGTANPDPSENQSHSNTKSGKGNLIQSSNAIDGKRHRIPSHAGERRPDDFLTAGPRSRHCTTDGKSCSASMRNSARRGPSAGVEPGLGDRPTAGPQRAGILLRHARDQATRAARLCQAKLLHGVRLKCAFGTPVWGGPDRGRRLRGHGPAVLRKGGIHQTSCGGSPAGDVPAARKGDPLTPQLDALEIPFLDLAARNRPHLITRINKVLPLRLSMLRPSISSSESSTISLLLLAGRPDRTPHAPPARSVKGPRAHAAGAHRACRPRAAAGTAGGAVALPSGRVCRVNVPWNPLRMQDAIVVRAPWAGSIWGLWQQWRLAVKAVSQGGGPRRGIEDAASSRGETLTVIRQWRKLRFE